MTKPLTEQELAEIKERVEKATGGPWKFVPIIDLREDIPKLIAEVERLRKALEFYADKLNYREMPLLNTASMYDENGIRIAEQEWAPPAVHYDYGKRARKALGGDNE